MKHLGWMFLLFLPSVSALGVDVAVESVGIGAEVEVGSMNEGQMARLHVCAVVTCVGDPGESEMSKVSANRGHAQAHAVARDDADAVHHTMPAWTLAVPAAGLLALLARLYWLGPGRIVAFVAGPGRLLGLGIVARWAWPSEMENKTRLAMVTFIEGHPGTSIQEARRHVGVAWGTAVYHLQRLERDGEVVSVRAGNHHRYWRAGTQEAGVRHAWAVLEQPMTARIAEAVHGRPGIHQGGLCEELDVATPTASKHLKRLVTYGLVMTKRVSRFTLYAPTERLDQILQLRAARAAA